MNKSQITERRMRNNFEIYLDSLEFREIENLNYHKNKLKISKELGNLDVSDLKFQIKCIKNRLKFIETQKQNVGLSLRWIKL